MAIPNDKAKRILGRVLDWLRNGAPHVKDSAFPVDGFDMSIGVGYAPGCGTACCIAGAICQFEGLGDAFSQRAGPTILNYFGRNGAEALAVKELGVPYEDARALFMPYDFYETEVGGTDIEIPPDMAADVLQRYISEGVVEWPLKRKDPEHVRPYSYQGDLPSVS